MSLTSILRDRADIRDGLRARLVRPPIRFEAIRAAPRTTNYGIVGTAFDYLLRFFLQRINRISETSEWVAQEGVELIGASELTYDLDSKKLSRKTDRQRRKAETYLEEAKRAHQAYLSGGAIRDELLIAALRLAYLDVALRVGPDFIDWKGLAAPDSRDAADLRVLLSLVDESAFKAKRVCLLNPTFGYASRLVGGADADILIDDCLIDVKNTKDPHLDSRDFFQLIGYYLLLGYSGMSCGKATTVAHPVNFVGLYFSRYGFLWKLPVDEVIPRPAMQETARWFFDSVCTSKAVRTTCLRRFNGPFAKYLSVSSRIAGKKARASPRPQRKSRAGPAREK